MQQMEQNVWQLIQPGVEELGLRLVRVRLTGGGNPTLQIMVEPVEADKDNMVSVDVEQCADVSRMASALLDVEDLISSKYHLEVSSTGLERPLVTLEDFGRYAGTRAHVKMAVPVEGRFKFAGLIENVEGEIVSLTTDDTNETVALSYADIHNAKRIFTDEEINELFKNVNVEEE